MLTYWVLQNQPSSLKGISRYKDLSFPKDRTGLHFHFILDQHSQNTWLRKHHTKDIVEHILSICLQNYHHRIHSSNQANRLRSPGRYYFYKKCISLDLFQSKPNNQNCIANIQEKEEQLPHYHHSRNYLDKCLGKHLRVNKNWRHIFGIDLSSGQCRPYIQCYRPSKKKENSI